MLRSLSYRDRLRLAEDISVIELSPEDDGISIDNHPWPYFIAEGELNAITRDGRAAPSTLPMSKVYF